MSEFTQTIMDRKLERIKSTLEKRRFLCDIVENKEQAQELVRKLIPNGATISLGGSMTLEETGILSMVYEMDVKVQDRYADGLSREQRNEVLKQAFTSDVLLTSTNALTMQGDLYNIDGNGNRVAAMIFGPNKVIVVMGQNKLVADMEEAQKRLSNLAAPSNAARLGKNTPCVEFGFCANCNSDERICDAYVTISRSHDLHRIHVIIIKEEYGY